MATPFRPVFQRSLSPHAPDELLVKIAPAVQGRTVNTLHSRLGTRVLRQYAYGGWQRIQLPSGMSVAQGMARYQAAPEIICVEPNYIYRKVSSSSAPSTKLLFRRIFQQIPAPMTLMAIPNDSDYALLWGPPKIGAPTAWNTTTGSRDVVIAVIDTGIAYPHPDLVANVWRNPGEIAGNGKDDDGNGYIDDVHGYDMHNNDSDPRDDDGHGSHVAGIIGAVGHNALGITGVNWQCSILALKALGNSGASASNLLEAMQYLLTMRQRGINVRVLNCSWGGYGYNQSMFEMFTALSNAGILITCAAGNGDGADNGINTDSTPFYPACYAVNGIISVAASDSADRLAMFSNFGVRSVDLAAPGVLIRSTGLNDGYYYLDGTSMASPYVAGAAALMLAYKPATTAVQLKSILLNSSTKLAVLNGKVASGGRLNLASAMQQLGVPPNQVARPMATPPEGEYRYQVTVALSSATSGAEIRYTTNGVTPTTSSLKYVNPISLTSNTLLKAKAFKAGMTESYLLECNYTVRPNTPPVALSQSLVAHQGSKLAITLRGNDADNDALRYTVVASTASGTLTGAAPNLSYSPAPGFAGNVSFTFKVNDGRVDSAPATVRILVNRLPVALRQSTTTWKNTPIAFELQASDADGDALTYSLVSSPKNGVLSGTGRQRSYTPRTGYAGIDSFTYRVRDVNGGYSGVATVMITILDTLPITRVTLQIRPFADEYASGDRVLLIANASGGFNLRYDYEYSSDNGVSYRTLAAASLNPTFRWLLPQVALPTMLLVRVRAKVDGAQPAHQQTSMAVRLLVVNHMKVTLMSNKPSPQPLSATPIRFTANAAGVNVQYLFMVGAPDSAKRIRWTTIRGYNENPVINWIPPRDNITYMIRVWAKQSNSVQLYDASAELSYRILPET